MKVLTIRLDDEVHIKLKNYIQIKHMCGSICGEADEFIIHVLKAIEKGKESLTLELIKPKRKGKKKVNMV